jgi:4-diphosphocytidyl-2-C-methyl-D-erythritol kinase
VSQFVFNQPLTTFAPAKLNIRLKITGIRPTGYHDLVSIMVPVGLFDRLEMRPSREPEFDLICRQDPSLNGPQNLACRAAMAFFERTDYSGGIRMELIKRIPVAAGLGGGSSDAAAVLLSLNKTLPESERLSESQLSVLAAGLGADVPFFLKASPCIAQGIGEILEPIPQWPPLWYVIVMPELSVSTAWVYQTFDTLPFAQPLKQGRELELTTHEYSFIITNLETKPFVLSRFLENDLERVTISRYPVIREIKSALMKTDSSGSLMSGSGPSVFGVYESEAKALGAKRILDQDNWGRVFAAKGLAGVSSSGKTRAFGARIRRFESSHPSQSKEK